MSERTNISAFERLRLLDPVFSIADSQIVLGLDNRMAKLYAKRWADGGMTQRFGGGVYFNLVRDPEGPSRRLAEAVDKLVRVPAVIVGGAALHAGGWTSQVHRRTEIAVPVTRGSLSVPTTEGGTILTPRYKSWFLTLAGSSEGHADGLPYAAPAYALADVLLSARRALGAKQRVGTIPPDELDMDNFGPAEFEAVRAAMKELGGSESEIAEVTEPYRAAVDREPSGFVSF